MLRSSENEIELLGGLLYEKMELYPGLKSLFLRHQSRVRHPKDSRRRRKGVGQEETRLGRRKWPSKAAAQKEKEVKDKRRPALLIFRLLL